MLHAHWSLATLILYLFLGFWGMLCIYTYNRNVLRGMHLKNASRRYYFAFVFIWTFFAVFRYVTYDIGGADAIDYIEFFKLSLKDSVQYLHGSEDYAFLYLNKVIRYFTDDYHWFFAVVYGLIAFVYAIFVRRFSNPKFCVVPFVLLFYVYLRSYNTLRSNLTSAVILMGLIFIADRKYYRAYIFLILSALIHKAGLLFAMAIPFCHYFKQREFKVKYAFLFTGVLIVCASIIRIFLMNFFSDLGLEGAYESYLRESEENSIFASATEFFGQWTLWAVLILQHNKITTFISSTKSDYEKSMYKILYVLCFYDLILMPFNTLMGIWRGYEFFYPARLCMWSMLIYLWSRNKGSGIRFFIRIGFLLFFVSWMIFRISRTYESSSLMPYIFGPFINLI